MNIEIKQKWINALKSGEYHQTTGRLHNANGFCCLGVLCDLYLKEKGLDWEVTSSFKTYGVMDSDKRVESQTLPTIVMEWAEMDCMDYSSNIIPLMQFNDNGTSFKKIAKLIQEYF